MGWGGASGHVKSMWHMGENYVQEEFLGEESLGEKYMGEKYVQ